MAKTERTRRSRHTAPESEDPDALTAAQRREIERRVADLDDRTRYIIVSAFTPKFVLFYNVSEDMYGTNDPAYATLFKRCKAARAIAMLLGEGIRILQCRVDRQGRLIKRSVPRVADRWLKPVRGPVG